MLARLRHALSRDMTNGSGSSELHAASCPPGYLEGAMPLPAALHSRKRNLPLEDHALSRRMRPSLLRSESPGEAIVARSLADDAAALVLGYAAWSIEKGTIQIAADAGSIGGAEGTREVAAGTYNATRRAGVVVGVQAGNRDGAALGPKIPSVLKAARSDVLIRAIEDIGDHMTAECCRARRGHVDAGGKVSRDPGTHMEPLPATIVGAAGIVPDELRIPVPPLQKLAGTEADAVGQETGRRGHIVADQERFEAIDIELVRDADVPIDVADKCRILRRFGTDMLIVDIG
jgi:hypothetical protein